MKFDMERAFEALLFRSRWLAAPIYLGLIFALLMLIVVFARKLFETATHFFTMELDEAVLAVLTFIDVALLANLVLIVIFAGYENFVSKMEVDDHVDRPAWMGHIDFSGLKLKLFASIVALTGIELLKSFMAVRTGQPVAGDALMWLVAIHVTFLLTAVLSALTDWLSCRAKNYKG